MWLDSRWTPAVGACARLPAAARCPALPTAPNRCRPPTPTDAASLHQGKHSTVCSFLDTRTGGVVAVKAYYKRTMGRRHYRNVRREVAISRLLAKQRFSGAVRLLGTFEDEGHIYLVQESCAGGDLYRRLVRAGGTLGEAEVCRDVVVPLLLTLTFLHASHIVHRCAAAAIWGACPALAGLMCAGGAHAAPASLNLAALCNFYSNAATSSPRMCSSSPTAPCAWATLG